MHITPSPALAFLVFVAIGSTTHADTISQAVLFSPVATLSSTHSGVSPTLLQIQPFPQTLGVLNSITEVIGGNATLGNAGVGATRATNIFLVSEGIMTIFPDSDGTPYPVVIVNDYEYTSPSRFGTFPLVGTGVDALGPLLATASGIGPLYAFMTTNLQFPDSSGLGTTLSFPGGIAATITYNYTPSPRAITPEPTTLVLLGTGLVSVVAFGRSRIKPRAASPPAAVHRPPMVDP